ncbi:toll/interleukin-1 receptor domain-containing protein [Rhodoplanes sp. SY1]|uniref:toll/interleukin-1 receptor domain-containing protein n=1 Tax=Rhodoplanes sp. SY1 TaxID=3166646 RepID=UPI0038B69BF8
MARNRVTIQLRQGDMFAQPTDLVIIPCSTVPTITPRVAERLAALRIAPPTGAMSLGDVRFGLFEGGTSIAAYVGYAASVIGYRSDAAEITRIATQVVAFAKDKPEIRDVALPLLGSGAGRLSKQDSAAALIAGLSAGDVGETVFNIYVLEKSDYDALTARMSAAVASTRATTLEVLNKLPRIDAFAATRGRPEAAAAPAVPATPVQSREPIRVFISYTRTSDEHQKWVQDLATRLRQNGIDARLDVWHLRYGMDLPQWMCNELDLAERVLIICNKAYAERAHGRYGGVGWEIRLVQGDLLQSQHANPDRYIPIVRGAFDQTAVPAFLRTVNCMVWSDQDHDSLCDTLLRAIYRAYIPPPEIGPTPPRFVVR